jgi:hypothetical protein
MDVALDKLTTIILKSLGLAVHPFTTLITVNVPVCADAGCALVLKYISYGNSR